MCLQQYNIYIRTENQIIIAVLTIDTTASRRVHKFTFCICCLRVGMLRGYYIYIFNLRLRKDQTLFEFIKNNSKVSS